MLLLSPFETYVYFLVVFTFLFCTKINAKCLSDLSVTGYTLVPNFNNNTQINSGKKNSPPLKNFSKFSTPENISLQNFY